jgi:hypothetical protein
MIKPFLLLLLFHSFVTAGTIDIVKPGSNEYLMLDTDQVIKWKVPPGADGKLEVGISLPSGEKKAIGKASFKSGGTVIRLSDNMGVGDGYFITPSSIDKGDFNGRVGPIYLFGPVPLEKKLLFNIPLSWKLTLPITKKALAHVDLESLRHAGIAQCVVSDKRSRPHMIGGYRDDKAPEAKWPVTITDTAAVWMQRKLFALYNDLGIKHDEQSELSVSVELLDFTVDEGDQYNGLIKGKTMIFRNQEPVWTGVLRGTAGKWGRTYKMESYQECIADSFIQFGLALLENMTVVMQNK